jgi:putative ABC transport system permease protein
MLSWWKGVIGRDRQESGLRRELDFHVEERVSDLVKSGLPEDDASRRLRQEFGGLDQVPEQCCDESVASEGQTNHPSSPGH